MFDVGISELALIAVVALIVLGPERLPRAARTVGAMLRRLRSSWTNLRYEIDREIAADELKRNLRDTEESIRKADPVAAVKREFDAIKDTKEP
ncbi:MAG TPA: Sec-independent protein translocase protein TatB [Patescibacteria group bacterium]|nr:Sec-independent protein translocase protein TatB [Patescibacteria group bacterium]